MLLTRGINVTCRCKYFVIFFVLMLYYGPEAFIYNKDLNLNLLTLNVASFLIHFLLLTFSQTRSAKCSLKCCKMFFSVCCVKHVVKILINFKNDYQFMFQVKKQKITFYDVRWLFLRKSRTLFHEKRKKQLFK